jgi:catechol 2,3-dioxygenase-like lactoylglutathione lyase family enzyme
MLRNVQSVVPFFAVTDMPRSIAFYESLGFTLKNTWVVDSQIRWCWLDLGGASLMLQHFPNNPFPAAPGAGVSLNFQCTDALALYHQFRERSLSPTEPQVGNNLWVTQLTDPDGYLLFFNSPTDVPEETKLSDLPASA